MAVPDNLEVIPSQPQLSTEDVSTSSPRGIADFLHLFFLSLEAYDIRYCILHSYERLPEVSSDLDIAIHQADVEVLQLVFARLSERGYSLVQRFNYAVGAGYFIFIWFEAHALKSIAIDVITEHRRGGLILANGETLLASKERYADFWIANPRTQFSYLLGKNILKGTIAPRLQRRLHDLAVELGYNECIAITSDLFGKRLAPGVTNACLAGEFDALLPSLTASIKRTRYVRDWSAPFRWCLGETCRIIARWFRPTGLSIALVGPDGVGKSTLVEHLTQRLQPLFRRSRAYHWRAGMLWSENHSQQNTEPHAQRKSTMLSSVSRLTAHLIDYWLGYWLRVRPMLARSGLIVFDRCFHDIQIDPVRYRYSGPAWFSSILCRLAPRPDLALAVDAPEHVVLSRKQEVSEEELTSQRIRYLQLVTQFTHCNYVDGAQSPEDCAFIAAQSAIKVLSMRVAKRYSLSPRSKLLLILSRALPAQGTGSDNEHAFTGPWYRERQGDKFRRQRFLSLPSIRNPRWLLPLDNPRLTSKAMDLYAPCTVRSIALRSGVQVMLKAGWKGSSRNRFCLPSKSWESLRTLVAERTREKEPVFSFSFGRSPRFSKLSVQVMNANTAVLGYLKLPLNESAVDRLRSEASALNRLHAIPSLRASIPEVLFAGEWDGTYILFESPVEGKRAPARFTDLHRRFLELLAGVDQQNRDGCEFVEEIAQRWSKIEFLLDAGWRIWAERALNWATDALRGKTLACSLIHGDFAPWNSRLSRGSVFVFDWESATTGVPVGWDYFHFHVQLTALLGRSSAWQTEVLRNTTRSAVLLLYLLGSVAALIEEGVHASEPAIRQRKRILVDLLDKRLK